MSLLYSSTCFEHNRAHHEEDKNCITQHLALSHSAGGRPMHLLIMSTVVLETCRGV